MFLDSPPVVIVESNGDYPHDDIRQHLNDFSNISFEEQCFDNGAVRTKICILRSSYPHSARIFRFTINAVWYMLKNKFQFIHRTT